MATFQWYEATNLSVQKKNGNFLNEKLQELKGNSFDVSKDINNIPHNYNRHVLVPQTIYLFYCCFSWFERLV